MTCSPMRDDVIGFVARWQGCSVAEAVQWLEHETSEGFVAVPRQIARMETPPVALADRDVTYRSLLRQWGLAPRHRTALQIRGLTDQAIRRAGFASAVPGLAPVTPATAAVPGFVRKATRWYVAGPAGLAIPVRAVNGQIQAIHIRVDDVSRGKYRWLSTPSQVGGAASGAPVHVARGVDDVVWITEGPLKAIVAQETLGHTVLGVPGAGAWTPVLDILRIIRPQRVILAFDRDPDPRTAEKVALHGSRLTTALTAAGWHCMTASWEGPKGLDDALVARVAINVRSSL